MPKPRLFQTRTEPVLNPYFTCINSLFFNGLDRPVWESNFAWSVREHREPGNKMKSLDQTLVKWVESNTAKPRVSLKDIEFLANPLILKVLVGQGIYIYSAIGEQNDSGNFPLFLPQKNVRAALPGLVSCGWWTWVGPRVHHHLQLNLHRPAIALRFPSWRFPHIPIESH